MADVRGIHDVDRRLGSGRLSALVTGTAGERPGYRALAQGVRTLLLDGRIPLRTRLPAERELATALGVSRATVTAAYDLLREGGFARSRRGAGTWTELPDGRRPAGVAAFPVGDGMLDLAVAAPGAPEAELGEALAAAGAALPRHASTPGYHPYGLPELREAVAERFTRRGLPTIPDQILITTGAQHALSSPSPCSAGRATASWSRTPRTPTPWTRSAARGCAPRPCRSPTPAGTPASWSRRSVRRRPVSRTWCPTSRIPPGV